MYEHCDVLRDVCVFFNSLLLHAQVLQVQHRDTHVVYALKAVSKAMLKSGKEEERLLAEAQILRYGRAYCITSNVIMLTNIYFKRFDKF